MQNYKGDALELKFENAAKSILDDIGVALDDFETNAYDADPLGGVIYDYSRSPLSNAIDRNIFLNAFNQIFTAFISSGTFESYISVFEKIFGDTVDVTFTIPAAGKLQIDLVASEIEAFNLVARYIVTNEYLYDEIIDYDGDNILVETVKGFQSEYELNQMLFELVPQGIYTEISLTFGS